MFSFVIALIYLLLAWHFQRTRWAGREPWLPTQTEPYVLGIVLLAHAAGLGLAVVTPLGVNLGIGNATSMLACLILLMVYCSAHWQNLSGLYPLLLPLAALGTGLQAVLPAQHLLVDANQPWFKLHLLLALMAYSLLSVATLLALFMTVVEYNLHHVQNHRSLQQLPPLLGLERLLFNTILAGFLLLTSALVSGALFSHSRFGAWFLPNHKNIFSLISWLVFGGLLLGHHTLGWRGRLATRLTLLGSVFLLLAYVGSKFVLEVVLRR